MVAVVEPGKAIWATMPELRPILKSGDPTKIVPEIMKLDKELAPLLAAAFPNAPGRT